MARTGKSRRWDKVGPRTQQELIDLWSSSLRLRPRTVRNYRYAVLKYARWLAAKGLTLLEATSVDLEAVTPVTHTPSTWNTSLNALGSFYKFAAKVLEGPVPNPVAGVSRQRVTPVVPKTYTESERKRYLSASNRLGGRWRMLAHLGVYGGLRLSEAAGLPWLADQSSYLRFQGKGGAERAVRVAPTLRSVLDEWRLECPSKVWVLPPSESWSAMWHGKKAAYGRAWSPDHDVHVHQETASKWHRDILDEAGLVFPEGWRGFHRTRHTAGTAHYRAGRDLLKTKKFLGHSSVKSTLVYVSLVEDEEDEGVLGMYQ